jgi:hypothetical protein
MVLMQCPVTLAAPLSFHVICNFLVQRGIDPRGRPQKLRR